MLFTLIDIVQFVACKTVMQQTATRIDGADHHTIVHGSRITFTDGSAIVREVKNDHVTFYAYDPAK